MAEEKAKLVSQRAAQKGVLSRLEKWLDSDDITDPFEVESRMKALDRVIELYEIAQSKIEAIDDKDKDREEFEQRVNTADAKMRRLKHDLTLSHTQDIVNQSFIHNPNVNVTLEHANEFSLPKPKPFDGEDYLEWPTFYNSFETLIHNSTARNVTPVKKFSALRECLKGKAYDAVCHLPLTEAGYAEARAILVKRYNKKRLLFESLIQKLLQISQVDNETALRDMYDKAVSLTKALEAIPADKEQIGFGILMQVLLGKVDKVTLTKWEEKGASSSALATWEEFTDFMDSRCNAIESVAFAHKSQQSSAVTKEKGTKGAAYLASSRVEPSSCPCCSGKCNQLLACQRFLKLPPRERYNVAKRARKCIRCLAASPHAYRDCSARCQMSNCDGKHHTLLHFDEFKMKGYVPQYKQESADDGAKAVIESLMSPAADQTPPEKLNVNSCSKISKVNKRAHVLATALIKVKSAEGDWFIARVLIDSGSMVNFVTKRFAAMIQAKFIQRKTDMKGMFAKEKLTHVTFLSMQSCTSNFESDIEAVILPKFDDCHPCIQMNIDELNLPENIAAGLADPRFNMPQHIDLILGVELAYKILSVGQLQLDNGLILQKTLLGWIAAGNIAMTGKPEVNNSCFLASLTASEADLLKRFWELEEAKQPEHLMSKEEKYCEQLFAESVARDENGRFIVKIPFKLDPVLLGESRSAAENYLRSIERRLSRQPVLKEMYNDFLNEYEALGHMTEVPEDEVKDVSKKLNYIPHHFVTKWDSSTTKLRVVFHASYETSSGYSFNAIQCVGPTLQPNLFDILLRARMAPILICADIAKMYRQILIDPEQRRHQCILWRRSDGRLVTFQLNTITYGTAAASFNAVRCLFELAKRYPDYELAVKAILTSTYIDDIITGVQSIEEGQALIKELNELLGLGCFPLRKWCSNSSKVLSSIPDDHKEALVSMGDETVTKTLGLQWNPETDAFCFLHDPEEDVKTWTKRKIISTVSKIFDPIGLISPVTCKAKMLCQHLWKLGLDWDESIDQSTLQQWLKLLQEMKEIKQFRFPRFVLTNELSAQIELHCFADASTKAYGAVFYIKCIQASGEVKITILCSKSRVAPVKTVSLPRLELCGAMLLADLFITVNQALNRNFDNVYCWLDSRVALTWIKTSPHRWKDFIASRVTKIQNQVPNAIWKHVPSEFNPADVISRGASPKALIENKIWMNGPDFLLHNEHEWSFKQDQEPGAEDEIWERKEPIFSLLAQCDDDVVERLECKKYIWKVRRVFAYVARFIKAARNKQRFKSDNQIQAKSKASHVQSSKVIVPPLDVIELDNGLKLAIRATQAARFADQRERLTDDKALRSSDPLIKLAPFIDNEGLIRVGGRLANAQHLPFSERHPVLLPKEHILTRIIFKSFHQRNMHPGPQALLAMVRGKYWAISGRVVAKQIYRSCKTCIRSKPTLFKQIMGHLPESRLIIERCFFITGVDLFGPFIIIHHGKGSRRSKMYVVVFVCFATKAVYITYVEDASTQAFLNALQRFVARRGCPAHLWSDNATNFTGANEVMKHIDWNQVDMWCREYKNIQWHFIPPRSPHFGGLWESAVKSAKNALLKVMSNQPLHFDAFNTFLAVIEGVLNSRPLTPPSSDPNDEPSITPAHFLTGTPMTTLPEPNVINFPPRKFKLIKHWQHLNEIKMHWFKRWSTELLRSYQVRGKWFVGSPNVKIGTLVYMIDPGTSQDAWIVGTIKELHVGVDGRARVATVETPSGSLFKRAVINLAPIPIDENDG